MADEADRASRDEASFSEENLARIRAAAAKEVAPPVGWDGETCYSCGDELPQERIAAKRFECVICRSAAEIKAKRGY